jgi:hypothetical protein
MEKKQYYRIPVVVDSLLSLRMNSECQFIYHWYSLYYKFSVTVGRAAVFQASTKRIDASDWSIYKVKVHACINYTQTD